MITNPGSMDADGKKWLVAMTNERLVALKHRWPFVQPDVESEIKRRKISGTFEPKI
jgi:hypothetical protein